MKPKTSTFSPLSSSARRSRRSTSGSITSQPTRVSDSRPTGRLIRNTQCQDRLSVIQPPRTGPMAGALTTVRP